MECRHDEITKPMSSPSEGKESVEIRKMKTRRIAIISLRDREETWLKYNGQNKTC